MGEGDGIESRTASARALPQLRTVLVCDLVDSTALIERLGDRRGSDCIRRHDRLARELLQRHGGREIDKTDGFLALFDRPVQAVAFALDYQRSLREPDAAGESLRARVGIHVGEVMVWENSRSEVAGGAKAVEVEGLAKPVAARLMSLARPGQILLSGVAQNLAQRAQGDLGALAAQVRWLTHGRYRFKGVPAPMLVHEVGEVGVAPLTAPSSSTKVQRELPWWRSPGALALEAALMLLTLGSVLYIASRPQPAIAFGERDWVVVGDLRNLTADGELSEALETAFRISLEQSRYVNVLSDLKVRDTLARMQREAEGIVVDRELGSEIALREGARALIVPTVADVGGRVRVSAEVIDPNTQTTVYAESADGIGAASALDSIDTVTHELRHRLGEALSAIDNDSVPLPKVTSNNIDALKAYASALNYYDAMKLDEATAQLQTALQLDPEFALAHVASARVAYAADAYAQAEQHLARAMQLAPRLPAREAAYLRAWSAWFGPTDEALMQWRTLLELYPDEFSAAFNFAQLSWESAIGYRSAREMLRQGDVSQNPARWKSIYLAGVLEMALGDLDAASGSFDRAVALGAAGPLVSPAHLRAAFRDHAGARARLGSTSADGLPALVWTVDEGEFARAEEILSSLEYSTESVASESRLAIAEAELHRLRGRCDESGTALARIEAPTRSMLEGVSAGEARQATVVRLAAALVMARCGQVDSAHEWMEPMQRPSASGEAEVAALAQAALAWIAIADGNATEQVHERVDAAISESELYVLRRTRFELRAIAGETDAALEDADWLSAQRGRAYVEGGSQHVLQLTNVADSALVQLRAAELLAHAGRGDEARSRLGHFLSMWPSAESGPYGPRVETLHRMLAGSAPGS